MANEKGLTLLANRPENQNSSNVMPGLLFLCFGSVKKSGVTSKSHFVLNPRFWGLIDRQQTSSLQLYSPTQNTGISSVGTRLDQFSTQVSYYNMKGQLVYSDS